jgi:hypothetical protein
MTPIDKLVVWHGCKIQVISGSKWQTIGECLWTPNAIKEESERLKSIGHKNLWVLDPIGERKPLF